MSFNKVVNGVTFTSDIYTNIDVRFEKQRAFTYIYISTTDNHAFNSTTISDYYIVHDYSGLSVTKIVLQNDNRTAQLSVWTGEFNENNSYNIKELPLIETTAPVKPTTIMGAYTAQSYENGTVSEKYNKDKSSLLTTGDTITYTVTPNKGYGVDFVKVYRFKGDPDTLDWSKGTVVKDFQSLDNLTYTITNDDLGNSIAVNAQFSVLKFKGNIENDLANTSYKIDNDVVTVTANQSYKITSAEIDYEPYVGAGSQKLIDLNVASDGSLASGILPDSVKNDSSITLTLTGETISKVEKFIGTIKNNIDNTSYTHDDKTITLTANDNFKITSATIDFQPYAGAGYSNVANFTINDNGKTATATIPSDYLNDNSIELDLNGTTESTKPYTLADVGLKCNDENATLKVVENTATLTAVDGYKITSATITSKNSFDFSGSTRQNHDFTISEDGSSATITLVPLKTLDYFLKVSTEEKPKQPTEKTFKGTVKLRSDVENKLTINFDKIKTVTIKVTDNKYNINSLFIIYQPYPGGGLERSNNGFTIAPDKKSATLVIPDEILDSLADDISIGGDIADTTPLTPSVAKTQRVYMVDDKGLNELTKQAESSYGGGRDVNYDFTEFINQLYYLPFTVDENLSTPTNKISTGLWELDAPAREMKDNILNIDLGVINVVPENNNGFDYNIESIKLYLPLVLPIQIDFQDCYKKSVAINYQINLLTGSATINVLSNDKLISTFNQNVQTNLQMFSIYNNKDFGTLNNSFNNGLLTPYIKVNYYKPVENLVSYETMEHNKLSSYTNFVKTRNASVTCGTQQEQQEIEDLLNGGIYIK